MNPSLLAGIAALVVALWLTSRRRTRPFLRSDDTSAVAALNRAQIALLSEPPPARLPASPAEPAGSSPPMTPAMGATSAAWIAFPGAGAVRQRRALLRQLDRWSQGSPDERFRAMAMARRWGHRCLLPLLHRGLRDPDPRVMAEAAAAIQLFRGHGPVSQPPVTASPASSRLRKVLRTR